MLSPEWSTAVAMVVGNVGSRGVSDAAGASTVGGWNKTAVSAAGPWGGRDGREAARR